MKKKIAIVLLTTFMISICLLAFGGCSSIGLEEGDFEIAFTGVKVKDNKVTIDVEFKNKSWHNGWIVSGGDRSKPSTLITIIYEDENGEPNWEYPSIAVRHWIKCNQVINRTEEFVLEKGKYKITAFVDFYCNENTNHFYFSVEQEIEIK